MNESIHSEPVVAIVVAAGSGSRLGASVPKALVPVAGVPLVARSIAQLAAGGVQRVVVVVAPDTEPSFAEVLTAAPVPVTIVTGGAERQDSVACGLAALGEGEEDQVILVHDAARAFVPPEVVQRVIAAVRAGADAVVPAIAVADSVRELHEAGSTVVDRSHLRGVQTPQGFPRAVIEQAHRALADARVPVTDDAAAAEFIGCTVDLVEGDRAAFKVTDPFDLLVAQALAGRP